MKKVTFIAALVCILFSCKKNKTTTPALPANFSEIKMSTIQAKETELSTSSIIATSNTASWQANDVFVFKTSDNLYGKFQVVSIDPANNFKIIMNVTVYNSDGSVKIANSAFGVRGTYTCDLDLLIEGAAGSIVDFHWNRLTGNFTNFDPKNNAKFAKYNF